MSDPEIERAGAIAKRHRLKQMRLLTPAQRIEAFTKLQTEALATMAANPVAHAAFIRRNHQQRRASNVRRLESILLRRRVPDPDE